ncbi:AAA-like domain protein [bacterium BMS3Abin15]|nr:AAA-like domain protein [bacterium BMS3Abin15]
MINSNKIIGRVLSVDNFRVYVKIDEDLLGSYKSGVSDIYEIARINSYLIIPVGADRVVALITRVTMKEEIEFDKNSTNITLPTSARYISATMLGTIANENNKERFIQGVYNFPTLDNPVWYVTEKDLIHIFDEKQNESEIEYDKDFYLPIGTSPAFSNYKVKICPDQFFVKHAAILGNTGSGKSCTLTSILRNLFQYDYSGKKLENAHIIIFDTNGEYKDAFLPEEETKIDVKTNEELQQINAYYLGGDEKVKVPYWFMNWDDFNHLLKPSDATQAPVLNRAIGLAKNEQESKQKQILPSYLHSDLTKIIDSTPEEIKKRTGYNDYGTWKWGRFENNENSNEILDIGKAIKEYDSDLGDAIIELSSKENFNNALKQEPIRIQIQGLFELSNAKLLEEQIINEKNIDMPTWFSYQELCTKFIDAAITQEGHSNNRIAEYVSTLRLRMNSFLNDKRMAIPLMLKDNNEANRNVLTHFLSFLLGDFNRYFSEDKKDSFIKKYNDDAELKQKEKTNQVTIIDVSTLPFEVLETVTALLGRLIIEFVSHFLPENRGKYPIVIVLEEAQNYIAENKESVAKIVFERIAREGRKYGISLIVCSQRPSELSKTVLSQCNSFIIHRLQNPEDQKYIRSLVSSANADILNQLPIIPQQHAIITGDCVRTPIQVKIDNVSPTPNSHNPRYVEQWLTDLKIPYEETCKRWSNIDNSSVEGNPKLV